MSLKLACERIVSTYCARKIITIQLSKPLVSFTFDDFPRSALIEGGAILAEHGLRGTYYTAMGLMGKKNLGQTMFTEDDLHALVGVGHELGCHTYTHVACRDISLDRASADCERNRKAIKDVLPDYKLCNFAFPFGSVSPQAKRLFSSVYGTSRGIFPGINRGKVDLALLRACSLDFPDRAKRVIEENHHKNGWLILYTHDVGAQPSSHGCSSTVFRELVQAAIASGAEILPIAGALARLSREFPDG